MRRVPFKSVMDRVAGLLQGVSSASGSGVRGLDRTDWAVGARFVTNAAREFWERYAWPELIGTERRLFRPVYASGSTYAAGMEVFFWGTQSYYQALRPVIAGQAPATLSGTTWTVNVSYWGTASEGLTTTSGYQLSTTELDRGAWSATTTYTRGAIVRSYVDGNVYQLWAASSLNQEPSANTGGAWGLRTDFVRSLDLAQVGQTEMSAVRRVWDVDPQSCASWEEAGHRLTFETFDGEVVVRSSANVVWAQFWKVCPDWTADEFDAALAYASGDRVYWTDGDVYGALDATSAGESPGTTPGSWVRLDFPRVLAEMVAWRVFGEMDPLHGEGPMGDGVSMAEEIFAQEVVKLERQQGQTRQLNVMTR